MTFKKGDKVEIKGLRDQVKASKALKVAHPHGPFMGTVTKKRGENYEVSFLSTVNPKDTLHEDRLVHWKGTSEEEDAQRKAFAEMTAFNSECTEIAEEIEKSLPDPPKPLPPEPSKTQVLTVGLLKKKKVYFTPLGHAPQGQSVFVLSNLDYEDSHVLGVYKTFEAAKKAVKKSDRSYEFALEEMEIEE